MDVSSEIKLQTTRSGGKGGQNVNKVETAVLALFHIEASLLLTPAQKEMVKQKLPNRINSKGELYLKAQTHRTQLENKSEAIQKINELITAALKKKRMRIATRPSKGVNENRIQKKKQASEVKSSRKKFKPTDY